MAKPKHKILVTVTANLVEPIVIWIDNPNKAMQDIRDVEGVALCRVCLDGPIRLMVDPRYDIQEVADEIKELLNAEVPSIFRE